MTAYTVEHSDLDAATAASSWAAGDPGWDTADPVIYESVRAYACEHDDGHLPHCADLAVTR